MASYLFALL